MSHSTGKEKSFAAGRKAAGVPKISRQGEVAYKTDKQTGRSRVVIVDDLLGIKKLLSTQQTDK